MNGEQGNILKLTNDNYETILKYTGNCGGFVIYDDTDSPYYGNVRLPSLTNGTLWGNDITQKINIGESLQAGLPNINGQFNAIYYTGDKKDYFSGAFNVYKIYMNGLDATKADIRTGIGIFNASQSSPVYGRSNTVQPPAIKVNWCIQVYNAYINVGNFDFNTFIKDCDYIISSYKNADNTRWYRKYKSGFIEQGGISFPTYPTDGTGAIDTTRYVYTISLPTPFSNTNYIAVKNTSISEPNTYVWDAELSIFNRTTTTMQTQVDQSSYNNINVSFQWYACGY